MIVTIVINYITLTLITEKKVSVVKWKKVREILIHLNRKFILNYFVMLFWSCTVDIFKTYESLRKKIPKKLLFKEINK